MCKKFEVIAGWPGKSNGWNTGIMRGEVAKAEARDIDFESSVPGVEARSPLTTLTFTVSVRSDVPDRLDHFRQLFILRTQGQDVLPNPLIVREIAEELLFTQAYHHL